MSTETIRAWACGLRTVWPQSIPSAQRSLPYWNAPFVLGTPSMRWTLSPTPRRTRSPISRLTPSPPGGDPGAHPTALRRDLVLVGGRQAAVPDHRPALHEQVSDPGRRAQQHPGHEVALGPG